MSRWSSSALAEGRFKPSWHHRAEHTDRTGGFTRHLRPRYDPRVSPGQEPTQVGTAMVASATLVSRQQVRAVMGRKGEWQKDVWHLYDEVPELRFGISWAANACSRARLYVGKIDPDGSSDPTPIDVYDPGDGSDPGDGGDFEEAPQDQEQAQKNRLLLAPLDELAGGRRGQAEMLRRMATQLNLPGESYLIGFDDPDTGERRWLVCSGNEVRPFGHHIKIMSPDIPGAEIEIPIAASTILRIWRPHADIAQDADSPVRALRTALRELLNLSAHIEATAESRLAGAGLLFLPSEITTPRPEQGEGANPYHGDPFTNELIKAMAAPLKNRDDASAIVPLVVRGPAEAGDKIKHISFATPFDANVPELRQDAIRRIAVGMDMPPEILTGMGGGGTGGSGAPNHWGAWQIEESAQKLHIEPLLGLICDSLTSQFFQPALRAMGVPDWRDYAIWYETSDLALRPNRSEEAADAYAKGAISEEALRRELGFSDQDAPTENERAARLADHIARTNANLAPVLLPRLGIPLSDEEKEDADPQGKPAPMGAPTNTSKTPGATTEAPAAAGTAGRNEIPAQHAALDDRWRRAALDMAVRRALKRVGQRLIKGTPRSARLELQAIPVDAIHTRLRPDETQLDRMLTDAYAEFVESTPEETCLHGAVDAYVRALLLTGEQHRPEYLASAVAQFGCE